MNREERLDLEIPEEDLREFIDDFKGFASRKKSREYRKKFKGDFSLNGTSRRNIEQLKADLEKRPKSDLVFILYRLMKRQIDPAMRRMYRSHLNEYSKSQLIQHIIDEYTAKSKIDNRNPRKYGGF